MFSTKRGFKLEDTRAEVTRGGDKKGHGGLGDGNLATTQKSFLKRRVVGKGGWGVVRESFLKKLKI